MFYEELFIRINSAFRHHPLLGKYAKNEIIKNTCLSISRIKKLSKELQIYNINKRKEFDKSLSDIDYNRKKSDTSSN